MHKLFFASLFLAVLFCSTPVVLAENGAEECDAALKEKTSTAVLVERTQKGLIGIADYDVLDKLDAIAKTLGKQGVPLLEYKVLQDGGVEVTFSIHPDPTKK